MEFCRNFDSRSVGKTFMREKSHLGLFRQCHGRFFAKWTLNWCFLGLNWCWLGFQNHMKLNPKKTKEICISFQHDNLDLSPLLIGEQIIETVQSHKVLGLTIQSNLKWNKHINSIVAKASNRILRRNGVPVEDLIEIYFALIHSVLEYCCLVWHNALANIKAY